MWKAIFCAAITVGLIITLSTPLTIGTTSIPPLGRFLSPSKGFWKLAEGPRKHDKDLVIKTDQLSAPVRIVLDERLVPHIFAETESDAAFAQGYVLAKFRLFQMDLVARATAGTLSEIIGDRALAYDREQRNKGMLWAAENTLEGWQAHPDLMEVVEAYCDGVNHYIDNLPPRNYPFEFKLLNYSPSPWSPLKMALFIKKMAADLCATERDLHNTNLMQILGEESFQDLFPEYNPIDDPIIPKSKVWDFKPVAIPEAPEQPNGTLGLYPGQPAPASSPEQLGSNNWAVSKSKSATGNPILCSDPHLSLSLPSIWYENHIVTPEYNVHGVSLPGVPWVVIGFNEHIAWGMTNVGHDVMDWYSMDWANRAKTKYWLDGETIETTQRFEEIQIKGQPTVIDTITYTVWGPVMKNGSHKDLAMKWIAHEVPQEAEVSVFSQLNKAKNYEDYRTALSSFSSPAQNFVFASVENDIAMTIGGKLPLRRQQQGRFVQDGSLTQNAWQAYIPFSHNPYIKNPDHDYVASANQQTTDSTYPYYYLATPYFEDYRGRTVNIFLRSGEQFSPERMKELQNSRLNLRAKDILPAFLNHLDSLPAFKGKEMIQLLKDWDFNYDPDSRAAIIFEELFNHFFALTWDEFDPFVDSVTIAYPEEWRTIDLYLQDPDHPFFDNKSTDLIERGPDILSMAFEKLSDSYDLSSTDPADTQWGHYRKTSIAHLLSLDGFGYDLPVGSHGDALNAISKTTGPSWRMIVDLSDRPTAQVIYPGGQSGNPGSQFYDNAVADWVNGHYYTVTLFQSAEEISSARGSISLQ